MAQNGSSIRNSIGISNDDAISIVSSSSLMSSPPASPPHSASLNDSIHVAHNPAFTLTSDVTAPASKAAPKPRRKKDTVHNISNNAPSNSVLPLGNGTANIEKPKRQRRKKDATTEEKNVDGEKPKRSRKPKEPKDKSDPTQSSTTLPSGAASTTTQTMPNTASAPRKKQKTDVIMKDAATVPAFANRQPTLEEMIGSIGAATRPITPAQSTNSIPPRPASTTPSENAHRISSIISNPSKPPPAPSSRGQSYDPVRGFDPVRAATMETAHSRVINTPLASPAIQAAVHVNRASASPSIASLIDPPTFAKPANARSPQPPAARPATVPLPSPHVPKQSPILALLTPQPLDESLTVKSSNTSLKEENAMDIDVPAKTAALSKAGNMQPPVDVRTPKTVSPAITPKISRNNETSLPKATGSGLLSSSDLFGGPSNKMNTSGNYGVNIDIQISLNPNGGNVINIAQEIAKKYGHDAINPRAAAHRDRLKAVAAAAKKIEGSDGDDISVDGTSDLDIDSNIEMGGMEDDKSATGVESGAKPIKRRRKKIEEYDKEDEFIDDTELAWQENAAVAKDGFFVYSGPLVPPGQDAQIESSAPARGRGRNRGGRGGARSNGASAAQSAAADKGKDATDATRGRGRGRGGGAPRKPRAPKADKDKSEVVKASKDVTAPPATFFDAALIPGSGSAPPLLGEATVV